MQTRENGEQDEQERMPLNLPGPEKPEPLERVAEPERYAGYLLLDPLGQKIGRVERVFTSARGEPQYVRVRTGWLASRTLVIPTNRISVDENRRSLTLK